MKKLLFLSLAIASICMVSCKKDRICECTVSSTTFKTTFNDATKRQAKDACVSQTYDNGNGTSTKVECKLK
ncbi:MAG: hypothetical protein PSX81_02310 [bacterium]|nr:hypothetical protein [bacterium]